MKKFFLLLVILFLISCGEKKIDNINWKCPLQDSMRYWTRKHSYHIFKDSKTSDSTLWESDSAIYYNVKIALLHNKCDTLFSIYFHNKVESKIHIDNGMEINIPLCYFCHEFNSNLIKNIK